MVVDAWILPVRGAGWRNGKRAAIWIALIGGNARTVAVMKIVTLPVRTWWIRPWVLANGSNVIVLTARTVVSVRTGPGIGKWINAAVLAARIKEWRQSVSL